MAASDNRGRPIVPKPAAVGYLEVPGKQSSKEEPCWVFSFKYFKRIDKFCLGHEKFSASWMASLLDRIGILSGVKVKDIVEGPPNMKKDWHWHRVDWNAKNIPVQRRDLDWVPAGIPSEEFYQIKIQDGAGRLIGFLVDNVFNVVLLDSMHNMYPSSRVQHQVREARLVRCRYDQLEHKLLVMKSNIDHNSPPKTIEEIKTIMSDEMDFDHSRKVVEIHSSFHVDIEKIMDAQRLESYPEAIEHILVEYLMSTPGPDQVSAEDKIEEKDKINKPKL